MHLESVSVDRSRLNQGFHHPDDSVEFAGVRSVVVVIVEQYALRGILPGIFKGVVDEILTDHLGPPGTFPDPVCPVVNSFVHHVPADDDARVLLFRLRQHFPDIVLHSGQHDFPAHDRFLRIVSLMEEGFRRLAVPDQHMAVDLDAVRLGKAQQRFRRVKADCHRRLIFLCQLPAGAYIQHAVRFQLVFRCQDTALVLDQLHQLQVAPESLLRHGHAKVKLSGIGVLQSRKVFFRNLRDLCRSFGFLCSRDPVRGFQAEIPDLVADFR